MKKYVVISGFNVHDNNGGSAALAYGSIAFCILNNYLKEGQEILGLSYTKRPWEIGKSCVEKYRISNKMWTRRVIKVSAYEHKLFRLFGVLMPFTHYGKIVHEIDAVAAINGGDGFSDIYNTETFYERLPDIIFAIKAKIPLIILPQTLGPFKLNENLQLGQKILKYAKNVYVRDSVFIKELERMGINYSLTKDLSYYMDPEPVEYGVKENSVGLNVSGLCYSNNFRSLSGQFDAYPKLIDMLISNFQDKGKTVYLIPHSYHYGNPEKNNDDIEACKIVYERHENKKNLFFINENLTPPQVKYIISQMSFFIGSRMHANFAAIYTGVPVFGLAYSWKFEGAFTANGLNAEKQIALINNLSEKKIEEVIRKINNFYIESQ